MSEKEVGIKLTAKDALSKTMRGIGGAVKQTTGAFKSFASQASQAVESVTRKLFFLKEAVNTITGVLKGFWNAFIQPAINARKLSASLTNVFGGGTAARIKQFSKDTGLAFEAVSKGALEAGKNIEKAGGMEAYLKAVERVSKWRPDLGAEGAVAFVNDLVNKVGEATEGSAKQLGRYTSVVVGGTKAQAVDLAKELDKLGVVNRVADPALSAFDKLREAWNQFKASVGEKVLDKLAEGAIKLLETLQDNESVILQLTDAFTNLVNQGLQRLIDWLDSDGPERLIGTFQSWGVEVSNVAGMISSIWQEIQPIIDAMTTVSNFTSKLNPANLFKGAAMAGYSTAKEGMGGQRGIMGAMRGVGQALSYRGIAAAGAQLGGGGGQQQVAVTVSVDDSGAIQAYTNKEINRNNAELVSGGGLADQRTVGRRSLR